MSQNTYFDEDFFFTENLFNQIKKFIDILCGNWVVYVGIRLHEEITQKESMNFLDVLF